MQPGNDAVLIVIDMQNDFLRGGSLAVSGGDEIIPTINSLAERFRNVVLTQDWHPGGHISFASSHPGRKPFETMELPYGRQVLWPDHCIQGTKGAEMVAALDIPKAQMIIRKGYHADTDSYSAFAEADRVTHTGLAGYLRERGIGTVFCVGLAMDYCVSWTALDAHDAGFNPVIIENACRAIDSDGSLAVARRQWRERGIETIEMN